MTTQILDPRPTIPESDIASETREPIPDRWGFLQVLFLLSAFIAPMNLHLVRAFTLYDLVTGALAILLIAGPWRVRRIPSSLRLAALTLLFAGLVSAFRSTYPLEAMNQVLQYGFIFFIQLPVILTLARSRTDVNAALTVFTLGYLVVVVAAIVLGQHVAGRLVPFFNQNPGALGAPTAFIVPFAMYFALESWAKRRRLSGSVLAGVGFCLMLWAVTAAGSRGTAIGAIASMTFFVAFNDGVKLSWRLIPRIGLVVLTLTGIGAAVYLTNIFPASLRTRVELTLSHQQLGPSVTDGRIALDHAGWNGFLDSPLVGTGFDNFRYVAQFYDPQATFHDPHNLWVQFLAQTGLFGALAFLFVIVRWLVMMFRVQVSTGSRSHRRLLCAFIAAFVGILTMSLATPQIELRQYWVLYGLGIAAAVSVSSEGRTRA